MPTEVHCLAAEGGELPDEPIVVDNSGMKLGRTAPADIIVPHKSVSREHCLLGLANDELFVTDLNSTNGTFIDGARITRTTILPVGSLLQVGQVALPHSVMPSPQPEQLGRAGGGEASRGPPGVARAAEREAAPA